MAINASPLEEDPPCPDERQDPQNQHNRPRDRQGDADDHFQEDVAHDYEDKDRNYSLAERASGRATL